MDVRIVIPLLASLTFLINLALTFARCDGSPFTFYKMDVNGDGACSDPTSLPPALSLSPTPQP